MLLKFCKALAPRSSCLLVFAWLITFVFSQSMWSLFIIFYFLFFFLFAFMTCSSVLFVNIMELGLRQWRILRKWLTQNLKSLICLQQWTWIFHIYVLSLQQRRYISFHQALRMISFQTLSINMRQRIFPIRLKNKEIATIAGFSDDIRWFFLFRSKLWNT